MIWAWIGCLCLQFAEARIGWESAKGLHVSMGPKHGFLSPLIAFSWVYSNFLIQWLERAIEDQEEQHETVQLMKGFFRSNPQGFLLFENRPHHPFTWLTPHGLGSVMETLVTSDARGLDFEALKEEIALVLLQDLSPKATRQRIAHEARKLEEKVRFDERQVQKTKRPASLARWREVLAEDRARLRDLEIYISELHGLPEPTDSRWVWSDVEPWAEKIARSHEEVERGLYPKGTTEQLLMSYLWLKGTSKADLLECLGAMPSALSPLYRYHQAQGALKRRFENEIFHLSDYVTVQRAMQGLDGVELRPLEARLDFFLMYLFLTKECQGYFASLAHYEPCLTFFEGAFVRYCDCAEAAVYNFLKLSIRDATPLTDSCWLARDRRLREFHEKTPVQEGAHAREGFNLGVIAHRDGVMYRKPEHAPCFELSSDMENITRLLEHLLKLSPLEDLRARWERILETISTETVDYKLLEFHEGTEIILLRQGQVWLRWSFVPEHTWIELLAGPVSEHVGRWVSRKAPSVPCPRDDEVLGHPDCLAWTWYPPLEPVRYMTAWPQHKAWIGRLLKPRPSVLRVHVPRPKTIPLRRSTSAPQMAHF